MLIRWIARRKHKSVFHSFGLKYTSKRGDLIDRLKLFLNPSSSVAISVSAISGELTSSEKKIGDSVGNTFKAPVH